MNLGEYSQLRYTILGAGFAWAPSLSRTSFWESPWKNWEGWHVWNSLSWNTGQGFWALTSTGLSYVKQMGCTLNGALCRFRPTACPLIIAVTCRARDQHSPLEVFSSNISLSWVHCSCRPHSSCMDCHYCTKALAVLSYKAQLALAWKWSRRFCIAWWSSYTYVTIVSEKTVS